MPWVLTILLVCCATPATSAASSCAQDAEQDYQTAYLRWRDADPKSLMPEKRAAIRDWAQENASKVDRLGPLHEKVAALAR